jgi:hypothetical protein
MPIFFPSRAVFSLSALNTGYCCIYLQRPKSAQRETFAKQHATARSNEAARAAMDSIFLNSFRAKRLKQLGSAALWPVCKSG